jgi:hypothetical protein
MITTAGRQSLHCYNAAAYRACQWENALCLGAISLLLTMACLTFG